MLSIFSLLRISCMVKTSKLSANPHCRVFFSPLIYIFFFFSFFSLFLLLFFFLSFLSFLFFFHELYTLTKGLFIFRHLQKLNFKTEQNMPPQEEEVVENKIL
uniref:Uncharacterized protein n=1 Tax=Cacopsylla melanoneura TaxID=428564 RepID=A0A8D8S0W2_9HEMI